MLDKKGAEFNGQGIITAGEAVNYRDGWRIFRIIAEFVEGYEFLSKFKREVTVLGSARMPSNSKYYKIAVEFGKLLAKSGFTTVTGGGPGIMEAANKGAFEAGGESVGINIQLPFEQRINPYVKNSTGCYYFFTRKVILTSPAHAFVFFPGGFGTLDEFFEVVDYMELNMMQDVPVVLVGKEYWLPIINFLRAHSSAQMNSVDKKIIDKWSLVETAEDAFECIKHAPDQPNELSSDSPLNMQGGADWRMFRIMGELVDGFEFLTKIKNDVTVFGTKSSPPGTKYYKDAQELGKILAQNNMTVVTGGGPGIMEAANKGAFEAGGESVGINIRMEKSERINPYITKSIGFVFPFVRKLIITAPSEAFVFFPGGFGTLHQLFELLTLQETQKVNPVPILLYDKNFWSPIVDFVQRLYSDFQTISQNDRQLMKIINEPKEVLRYLV
jgi:uncharacterized protein (TIGR00730 family)